MLENMNPTYRNYIIVGAFVVLFGVSIVFRGRISMLLGGSLALPQPSAITSGSAAPGLNPSASASPGTSVIEAVPDQGKQAPKYTGRDPGEIRPNEHEVKGFTTAQKNNLFDEIRKQAGEVKKNPLLYSSWLQIGVYKKTIGDYIGARDAWEYAALLAPQEFVPHYDLGQLYWHNIPDYLKAEAKFKAAIALKIKDASSYKALSDLYLYSYKGKAGLADDVLLDGLKAMPNDINLLKALGYVYEEQKEYAKALAIWEKVLVLTPNDTSVKTEISDLKGKLGQQ